MAARAVAVVPPALSRCELAPINDTDVSGTVAKPTLLYPVHQKYYVSSENVCHCLGAQRPAPRNTGMPWLSSSSVFGYRAVAKTGRRAQLGTPEPCSSFIFGLV